MKTVAVLCHKVKRIKVNRGTGPLPVNWTWQAATDSHTLDYCFDFKFLHETVLRHHCRLLKSVNSLFYWTQPSLLYNTPYVKLAFSPQRKSERFANLLTWWSKDNIQHWCELAIIASVIYVDNINISVGFISDYQVTTMRDTALLLHLACLE